jgi:uncharacterized SAM-binding protein YcdF (DUF218 family)
MITLLCIGLFIFHKKRALIIVLIIQAALLYIFSITPVKNALLLPLENAYIPPTMEQIEETTFIVILGGGVVPDSPAALLVSAPDVVADVETTPELGGEAETGAKIDRETVAEMDADMTVRGALSSSGYKRTGYGAAVYRLHPVPIVVSGGVVFHKGVAEPEAVIAKRTLTQLGIPGSDVITEEESRNTWENAKYTADIVGDAPVLLVTSAYHMPRSVSSFKKHGVTVVPAPTDYKSMRVPYSFIDFLPDIANFYDSYAAIHEYVGYVYYSLKKAGNSVLSQ